MIFTFFSCTYDYFEDENNFRLYVPQIEAGTISSFYVAFHDATTGKHVYTRKLEAPFPTDDFTKQGILRFKLRGGDYHISCFADYTPHSLTEGNDLNASYKYKFHCNKSNWLQDYGNDMYDSRTSNPRMRLISATVYPLGYAGGNNPVLADMDETTRFNGKVDIEFVGLPSEIVRADVIYKGLATKVCFDGIFDRFTGNDRLMMMYENLSQYNTGGSVVLPTDIINASVGCMETYTTCSQIPTAPLSQEPLELEIYFYGAGGSTIGSASFTEAQFAALPPAKKPQDANGNPITSLVLHPRETIKFVFDGFTVVRVELVGWGDTSEGGLTPM